MEPTIRAITCPHCKNILFALELETKSGGTAWNITKDSPAVQKDAGGNFMQCGRCSKRVDLEKVAAPGMQSWKVSASAK